MTLTRDELARIGRKLGLNCGGPGGSPGPCPTHSTKVPKKRTKLTMVQAGEALSQMGYKLGKGHTDLKSMTTTYEVEHPDGKKSVMSVEQVKELIYRGIKT